MFLSGVRLKLVARAIAGSFGIICQFHGLRYLPLADVNMIAAASPIFTVFFAWMYIRERAGPADFLNLLLVFAGGPAFHHNSAVQINMARGCENCSRAPVTIVHICLST